MCTDNNTVSCGYSREVLYIPDINEDDKHEADISSDKANIARESRAEKAHRWKKNKQR